MRIYTKLDNNGVNIFVFGSNEAGIHGAGAALEAYKYWGAEYRLGFGRQGNSYAIPTKDRNLTSLSLEKIKIYVNIFIKYANAHPELVFLVTKIGCGLAGYKEKEIIPLFNNCPNNCVLPDGWSLFAK